MDETIIRALRALTERFEAEAAEGSPLRSAEDAKQDCAQRIRSLMEAHMRDPQTFEEI